MKWEDERYCRVYTRDTSNWVSGPWQARAVLPLVVRKLDRSGVIELDDNGLHGLAALIGLPVEVVEPGTAWWLLKGTFVISVTKRDDGDTLRGESSREFLTMPNYVAAQECSASDRKRSQDARERMRITRRDDGDTKRDDSPRTVSPPSRMFATRHSVPSRAVPCRADPPERERDAAALTLAAPTPEKGRKATRAERGKRAKTTVPASDAPTGEVEAFCQRWGVPLPATNAEAAKMLDHFRANGKAMLDWGAVWANWQRRAPEFGGRGPGVQPAAPVDVRVDERQRERDASHKADRAKAVPACNVPELRALAEGIGRMPNGGANGH